MRREAGTITAVWTNQNKEVNYTAPIVCSIANTVLGSGGGYSVVEMQSIVDYFFYPRYSLFFLTGNCYE